MLLTVFALFAGVALVSAIVVVLHRNPVVSTMSLVVTLVATAGLFIMLGSPFLAALQILLYSSSSSCCSTCSANEQRPRG